jgi:apolipoprotein D and lipocalin family protein
MKNKKLFLGLSALALAVIPLSAFRKIPKGVEAVKNFDQKSYLGTWYEIARMDYKWEHGLERVTATYSLNDNGTIKVDNKGYDTRRGVWKQSVGKAKPAAAPDEGRLKVSFFGPFYAGYNVVALDKDYTYALVIGGSTDYMWILSREKTIPPAVKQRYVAKAKALGIKTEELIWVNQN